MSSGRNASPRGAGDNDADARWRRYATGSDATLRGWAAAPGRVNLVGEHTDDNDGSVLPCALDRTTLVALARRTDSVAGCFSDGSEPRP